MFLFSSSRLSRITFFFLKLFSKLFFFIITEADMLSFFYFVVLFFIFSFVILFFYHAFMFFVFCHLFLTVLFHLQVITHNFFLFLSFSLELRLVNFDFLFTGEFTLLELVFSFYWFIANFTFCFSSSSRTDCRIIDSAISETSSEVELTPAVQFNGFGGAAR